MSSSAAFKWHAIAATSPPLLIIQGIGEANIMSLMPSKCVPAFVAACDTNHAWSPLQVFLYMSYRLVYCGLNPAFALECALTLSDLLALLCYALLHKLYLHRFTKKKKPQKNKKQNKINKIHSQPNKNKQILLNLFLLAFICSQSLELKWKFMWADLKVIFWYH